MCVCVCVCVCPFFHLRSFTSFPLLINLEAKMILAAEQIFLLSTALRPMVESKHFVTN
jgi:hypothetical protein